MVDSNPYNSCSHFPDGSCGGGGVRKMGPNRPHELVRPIPEIDAIIIGAYCSTFNGGQIGVAQQGARTCSQFQAPIQAVFSQPILYCTNVRGLVSIGLSRCVSIPLRRYLYQHLLLSQGRMGLVRLRVQWVNSRLNLW